MEQWSEYSSQSSIIYNQSLTIFLIIIFILILIIGSKIFLLYKFIKIEKNTRETKEEIQKLNKNLYNLINNKTNEILITKNIERKEI